MKETVESQNLLAARLPADQPLLGRGILQTLVKPAPGITSLDQKHESALRELLGRSSWSPADLRIVTAKVGLMPWACVATLNEWALKTYGDLLLEGDPIVTVNQNLKQKLQV